MAKRRPKLLDLFCGAGGCAVGYRRAGFDVVGVDHRSQPHYPFRFVQADALEYAAEHAGGYAAVHASPPCQLFSLATLSRPELHAGHQDLLRPTLQLLPRVARCWVVENVETAPVPSHGFRLCGLMFGLSLFRHRRFACSHLLWAPEHPTHRGYKVGVGGMVSMCGHGDSSRRHRTHTPADHRRKAAWVAASGIDWMTRDEMAQAIPPAYTEWIGRQLLPLVERRHDRA